MKKRIISLLLTLTLALSLSAPALAARDVPSDWANDAVTWLKSTNMLTAADFSGYDRTVTRADFARLGVVLYELITRKPKPAPVAQNPFTDTDNTDVLRAYRIGLVAGTGDGTTFSPYDPVNREQIAVMLMRVLDACGITYSKADTSAIHFTDENELSAWAADAVKRAYLIQIMNGTGGMNMSPKMTVTMEQAYQLLYNIYFHRDDIRAGEVRAMTQGAVGTVSLKYTDGAGYESGYCEDAYHCRPVICDLDQDGTLDIVAASYSVACLDAQTGALKWRFPAGKDRNTAVTSMNDLTLRTWSDIYVGDVDGDGRNEIVAGHGNGDNGIGVVAVYDENGYLKPGWPHRLNAEVYSIAVDDLDDDGTMEIAAGIGLADGLSVYVYEHTGEIRAGWPQLDPSVDGAKTPVLERDPRAPGIGFAYGVFNDNIAIGDIDDDGVKEIVVPADMSQINAYKPDGTQVVSGLQALPSVVNGVTDNVVWGRVGTFSDAEYEAKCFNGGFGQAADLLGNPLDIASLPMNERLNASFTHGKAEIVDVDGNGVNEVVVVGDIFDRLEADWPYQVHLYQELFIFNGDRTRFNQAWAVEPTVKEPPLVPYTLDDFLVMERCMPDPVCADLDGDGQMEILYPSYSGKLNCYSLDHTQHDNWPINIYDGVTPEYPTPPAVVDLNGDGVVEVIFATQTHKQSGKNGSLYIADNKGNILLKLEMPTVVGVAGMEPNGSVCPPVVTDMDGDGKLEIVLFATRSAVTVYDLD